MQLSLNPRQFGIDHDDWRPHQYETVQWIYNQSERVKIVQAPTGSGKSAVGAALGHASSVRVLTFTKNLQEQYEKGYRFEPLYGMANYPCVFLSQEYNCDSCMFAEEMYGCPVANQCHYVLRRQIVKGSNRQALSYAYWFASAWTKKHLTSYLYCDEAHLIPRLVKEYSSIDFTPFDCQKMDIPLYPMIQNNHDKFRLLMAGKWLEEVLAYLTQEFNKLADIPQWRRTAGIARRQNMLKEKIERLRRTLDGIEEFPDSFFVWSNQQQFRLVPLTAKFHFSNLFINRYSHKVVLTSATIGNPQTLADELGIRNYVFRDVPSAFPSKSMPVYILEDAPRLSYKSGESAKQKWASVISDTIKEHDPAWNGIIHVSSRAQANDLANRMSRNGLQDRMYVVDGKGTNEKLHNWSTRLKKIPNTLCVSYSFHTGLDAADTQINIVAKTPFPQLDVYGQAEMNFNPAFYLWATGIALEQACGRTRRGYANHYEEEGEPRRRLVAIADSNFSRVKSQLSSHFLNCLTAYP